MSRSSSRGCRRDRHAQCMLIKSAASHAAYPEAQFAPGTDKVTVYQWVRCGCLLCLCCSNILVSVFTSTSCQHIHASTIMESCSVAAFPAFWLLFPADANGRMSVVAMEKVLLIALIVASITCLLVYMRTDPPKKRIPQVHSCPCQELVK